MTNSACPTWGGPVQRGSEALLITPLQLTQEAMKNFGGNDFAVLRTGTVASQQRGC